MTIVIRKERAVICSNANFSLIQTRKNQINESIATLRENLDEIHNNPVKVEDSEFDDKVQEVGDAVSSLSSKAAQKLGKNTPRKDPSIFKR